ncbi:hypothetical protein [Methylobacterium durans]|uniref:hypothetical protein n=1 Tax=Methylobacterium durans TaxID=2202825 RepID=UPI0013A59B11|nr:hypothetical protein [Methylobacterium durans]
MLAASTDATSEEHGMSPELRESRAALILLAVTVLSVLVFGAVTLISQIGG